MGIIKIVQLLRKVAGADSYVVIVISQGSAQATLRSTRTTLVIIQNILDRTFHQGTLLFD